MIPSESKHVAQGR